MADNSMIDATPSLTTIGIGLLGATASGEQALAKLPEARLEMIERRILRIEMALRRSGVEVEFLDLPK